jgi:uncharacterized protein (TIGR03086 family)
MNTMVSRIDQALDMTAAVVAGIPAARMNAPTPCVDWDVHELLNHLVGGMNIFAAQLAGMTPGREHDDDWLGRDPHTAFADAAAIDRAAWHSPDALERTVRLGFGVVPGPIAVVIHLTELLVHGVDLAVATDQERILDEQLCAEMLVIMRDMGMDNFRKPGMFGAELPAPTDALAHRELLAFLGRSA